MKIPASILDVVGIQTITTTVILEISQKVRAFLDVFTPLPTSRTVPCLMVKRKKIAIKVIGLIVKTPVVAGIRLIVVILIHLSVMMFLPALTITMETTVGVQQVRVVNRGAFQKGRMFHGVTVHL